MLRAAPFLHYQTYQQLLAASTDPRKFYPKQASCPLSICYFARTRGHRRSQLLPGQIYKPPQEVQRSFEHGVRIWQTSKVCKHVETTLRTIQLNGSVSRIVAFSNGTVSIDDSQRMILQHALILTMSDVLQSLQADSGIKIQCFAQDPAYIKTDRKVLQDAGITVLEDPRAFLEVSDESVVLSFAPDIPVRQIVTDLARPAIIICDEVKREQELLDDWSKRFDPPRTWASVEQLEGWL